MLMPPRTSRRVRPMMCLSSPGRKKRNIVMMECEYGGGGGGVVMIDVPVVVVGDGGMDGWMDGERCMRRGQVVERGGAEKGGGANPSKAIRRR